VCEVGGCGGAGGGEGWGEEEALCLRVETRGGEASGCECCFGRLSFFVVGFRCDDS